MTNHEPSLNRRSYLAATGSAGVLGLAGCVGGDSGSDSLLIGSVYAGGHAINEMAMDWAETVEEETDGEIEITIDQDFGGEGDLIEQTEIGSIDGSLIGAMWVDQFAPEVYWMECPFVFESWDQQYRAYMESEFGEMAFDAMIEDGNQRIIGEPVYRGHRLLTSNEEITSPDDLSGVTIRVPELEDWVDIWSGLGAETSTIAFDELYSALEQGVADAQENPAETIRSMSLYEVQSHLILTEHLASTGWLSINEDIWQGISEENRELMESELIAEIESLSDKIAEQEEEEIAELEEEMEVIEPDIDEWLELAQPTLEDLFEERWEGSTDEVDQI